MLLTRKLTIEEKKELLEALFEFQLINTDEAFGGENWIICDDEGNGFYRKDENLSFNFDTLKGFFEYHEYIHKIYGFKDCQFKLQKLLGVR